MGTIKQKADNISKKLVGFGVAETAALDPITIITLVSVLIQIFESLRQCYKEHHQAKEVMTNPGIFMKRRMRNIIENNINKVDTSRQDICTLSFKIEQGIKEEIKQTTDAEFGQMWEESK